MEISSDYKDLLRILNKHKVRYLIIGAYAVVYYTEPRFTKGIDIWVDNSEDNAERLYKALVDFGSPLKNVTIEDLAKKETVYQLGVAPVRIDILMGVRGLIFAHAWKTRRKTEYAGIPANILGRKELISSKKSAGRDQDILDLKKLTRKKTA